MTETGSKPPLAMAHDFDRRLAAGRVVGGWCAIPSSFSAELVAESGPDYVAVDLQHGLADMSSLVSMLQAIALHGAIPVVRVPYGATEFAQRALDAGALAIIVPMVNCADDARVAVRSCKYPPLGERSYGPIRSRWSISNPLRDSNDSTKCLVQIETQAAVHELDEILDVRGVDGVYVGPADLAISLGESPDHRSSAFDQALESIARSCRARGLVAAVHAVSGADADRMFGLGYQACTVGSDAVWLSTRYRSELSEARRLELSAPMDSKANTAPY